MFYQLPPVGNPVCLSTEQLPFSLPETLFAPYQSCYFVSGTAALAAAIIAAKSLKPVDRPEVILPAYSCPDLVSAAVYAGVKPVLVDLEKDRPWMDLEHVSGSVSPDTVAIIAANLLGISERMTQLRAISRQHGIVLIEDSAQAFPGADEDDIWEGDMVVLSFGRGKPVSLLGGGAVLYRDPELGERLPAAKPQLDAGPGRQIKFRLKASLYNWLINPRFYWIPNALPFLHLGETRYHPLADIEFMDMTRMNALAANIAAYRSENMKNQEAIGGIFSQAGSAILNFIDLPNACGLSRKRRLLRYPVLAPVALRDRIYRHLERLGLGPSVMYPTPLPRIPGLENIITDQTTYPVAEDFSARILTFPTHNRVDFKDIDVIRRVLISE